MRALYAKRALTDKGWASDVRLTIASGRIAGLEAGVAPEAGDEHHAILLPGMPNLHCHAFQRGMAGLAEVRGPSADSFWSWREVMYRFALTMTPDDVEAVAAQLYAEMLEAGFTRVGEFHYLHHDTDGRPYTDIAEMAVRIAAAAGHAGIGLTLLPVLYARGGFGGAAPNDGQRRFVNNLDAYARLLEGCQQAVKALPGAKVGVAPHSLRAVTPEELAAAIELAGENPVHIHIAEQVKEVEDCLAWSGQRPVDWLLGHAEVSNRWCLIHATHMTEDEAARMAVSGAMAGLCPITEANLGDGIFNAPAFMGAGGGYGVGSDSNVQISVAGELQQLEYSQRLGLRARNVMTATGFSTGRSLFETAQRGGALALGADARGIMQGAPADLVSLDAGHVALAGLRDDQWLDAWIFTGVQGLTDCVWVAGAKQVAGGRHRQRDTIAPRFRAVMHTLRAGAGS